MAFNKTILEGRLTRDIEVRQTGSGVAVGSGSIAVQRDFKNAQGERETDFFNFTVWRKAAETLAQYTSKGSRVLLEGTLQNRSYENKQGQNVTVTELVVSGFDFIETRNASNETVKQADSFFGGNEINIKDDDLPF